MCRIGVAIDGYRLNLVRLIQLCLGSIQHVRIDTLMTFQIRTWLVKKMGP